MRSPDDNQEAVDPFIKRVIVCALVAVFLMAGWSVFIMGQNSVLTGVLLTLASGLAGIGGWSIAKKGRA